MPHLKQLLPSISHLTEMRLLYTPTSRLKSNLISLSFLAILITQNTLEYICTSLSSYVLEGNLEAYE